jgi:hypothetical protein
MTREPQSKKKPRMSRFRDAGGEDFRVRRRSFAQFLTVWDVPRRLCGSG